MTTNRKKQVTGAVCAAAVVATTALIGWSRLASHTQIALVNFQPFQTASIVRANTDKFVRYEEAPLETLSKPEKYDFVLIFGMGLQITEAQRAQLRKAADRGTPVYVFSPTSPENAICNLDSAREAGVRGYLSNGNKKNYQSLAKYVRRYIDKKTFFINEPDSVVRSASDALYHLDETAAFGKVSDYETYLKRQGFFTYHAPKVAIVGGLNDPFAGNKENTDSLIVALQRCGLNVYPVFSFTKRLEFLKEIQPDAVVYYAHGRLATGEPDAAVAWLKERNIPLFAPLTLLRTRAEWLNDPMGMAGGFMSQSIAMPELDGAIYPYTLNAQEKDNDGFYLFKAMPDRLQAFTQIVNNFIALKRKRNADKKVAIYYFKGAGQSTLTAQGLETVPALYNFLKRLKAEGYAIEHLPPDAEAFEKMLMTQGAVLSTYAEGAFDNFLATGNPALVEKADYEAWVRALPEELYADVVATYGDAPGNYMAVKKNGKAYLAVARIELGNVALLPQPMAGLGNDAFAIVHGAKSAPPHTYIASYLWARYGFEADALLHFGTHGSLEFTPQKQTALSAYDWPDCLTGSVPHFYYYTIGNVGESMMAKRRAYATTISYLTPAFTETGLRPQFKVLQEKIRNYYKKAGGDEQIKASLEVKKMAMDMGLHRDLRLDSLPANPYSAEEIERIDNFAEEIACEKMTGHLYTSAPYSPAEIRSTVLAMSADPIAYGKATLDRLNGKASDTQLKSKPFFTQTYLAPAQTLVNRILDGMPVNDALVCSVAQITAEELKEAKQILAPKQRGMTFPAPPNATKPSAAQKPSAGGGHPVWIPKTGKKPDRQKETEKKDTVRRETLQATEYTAAQKARARAIVEIERAVDNVLAYKKALEQSPEKEFQSLLNALAGGYIAPSSGGDAVANPNAVPTGRNLYAVNAEAAPSEAAWEKGVSLADATLKQYKKRHGAYPRKVSYTFWSSEFIESEGATVAQALYMLGVEPVRDSYGRVSDLQLISSERLGRPRIDIVVQTSGQFRDLAASRLTLLSRAVEMAAAATGEDFDNYVAGSVVETERLLVERGVSPKEAREMSAQRIFGGINGMYGTNIQGMVTAGDKWESDKEIADAYMHNMGAIYSDEKRWGQFREGLLRAVLHNTDAVVQPRQSNTWGALSLDHVYEFMGGMNLAVREATGKDPEAYFADYRNRNNVRVQELKEAIGAEARATLFNPAYVKEIMKGKASSAAQITEAVTNTYGWNVMKPAVIDQEVWDKLYSIYVTDEYRLGTETFFRRENPQALQEITAVMLETIRKGYWHAGDEQLSRLVNLHTDLVKEFGSNASGFAGGNVKLQAFIAQKTDTQTATEYQRQLRKMQTAAPDAQGLVLKKDAVKETEAGEPAALNGMFVVSVVLAAFIILLLLLRKKRRQ
ncbi:MAG: Aerobic cobaltochelatase subunit CobN [Bacteroidales bacterium]